MNLTVFFCCSRLLSKSLFLYLLEWGGDGDKACGVGDGDFLLRGGDRDKSVSSAKTYSCIIFSNSLVRRNPAVTQSSRHAYGTYYLGCILYDYTTYYPDSVVPLPPNSK